MVYCQELYCKELTTLQELSTLITVEMSYEKTVAQAALVCLCPYHFCPIVDRLPPNGRDPIARPIADTAPRAHVHNGRQPTHPARYGRHPHADSRGATARAHANAPNRRTTGH
jgi:hypothetical protein